MKNLKLYWQEYQDSDLKYFKSFNNTWNNILNNSQVDHTIFFDSMSVPDNCSLFLIEPKSIHPRYYEYALKHHKRLKYIISYDKDFFKNINNLIHVPPPFGAWIKDDEKQIYNKTKNISFIASTKRLCSEHNYRQDMVERFKNDCDVFGRGRRDLQTKIEGLADYRFSFCMENHVTNLYYTEKLLDCFLTGTIPIYYGSKSISDVFDSNGIIFLDDVVNGIIKIRDLNEEYYRSKMQYVNNNFNIAKNMQNGVSNSLDVAISKGL